MRIACWVTDATNTHTHAQTHAHAHTHREYLTLIAFNWKQWLRERVSVLGYRYIACLVVK